MAQLDLAGEVPDPKDQMSSITMPTIGREARKIVSIQGPRLVSLFGCAGVCEA